MSVQVCLTVAAAKALREANPRSENHLPPHLFRQGDRRLETSVIDDLTCRTCKELVLWEALDTQRTGEVR